MSIYKLTQQETTKIPRDRAEYTDAGGNLVAATTEQYFWLPLQRLRDTKQVIWVQDLSDIGTLVVEAHTYVDSAGVTQDYDMQSSINSACLNYMSSTDWYITRLAESAVAVPQVILDKRAACRLAII